MKLCRCTHPHAARAFTLVECVVATAIVAAMTTTALTTVAYSVRAQGKAADRATGAMFADAMAAEIMTQSYADPVTGTAVFGLEPGETTASRGNWDDVDDYAAYSESPLQNRDGSVIPNTTTWRRSVDVAWVSPTSPASASATETGCKRVTIAVRHNGFVVATRVFLRTNAP